MWLERVSDRSLLNSLQQMRSLQQRLDGMLSADQELNGLHADDQFPALNVWVSEHQALVEAEIPGVESSQVELSVIGEALTIKGERKPEKLQEGEAYHRQERGFGPFARTIQLPFKINADGVEAKFKNGVLSVSLPRAEEDKPRRIAVKAVA